MESVEWQATVGGQIDAGGHGDVSLGVRSGGWTFALRTDAPEITWNRAEERGRGWIQARGHGFAAQMFISPWTDGAPDPARATRAASAGLETGWLAYGPRGTYAGARASLDGFVPQAPDEGAARYDPRAVGTLDAVAGVWTPALHGWLRAGVDFATPDPVGGAPVRAPHLHGQLAWLPDTRVGAVALAPRVELAAGVAEGQDDLLRTRLGGLNPWVVPLAGAAWGEWWVEDYAAARIGGTVGVGRTGPGALGARLSPFVDLAAFDAAHADTHAALGLGLGLRAWRGRLFLDAAGGWAPGIPRAPELPSGGVWFSVGWDWGTAAGPADAAPPGPAGVGWPGGA